MDGRPMSTTIGLRSGQPGRERRAPTSASLVGNTMNIVRHPAALRLRAGHRRSLRGVLWRLEAVARFEAATDFARCVAGRVGNGRTTARAGKTSAAT